MAPTSNNMAPTSTKHGTKLTPGRWQGVPGNQQKYKTIEKTQTQTQKLEKNILFLMRGDFIRKRVAQRLGVYRFIF